MISFERITKGGSYTGWKTSWQVMKESLPGLCRQDSNSHVGCAASLPYWILLVDKKKTFSLTGIFFPMNQIYNKLKSSYLLQCSTVHLLGGCRLQTIGSATVSPIYHYFHSSWEMKAQPWPWEYGLWKGLSSCLFPSLHISLPLLSAESLFTDKRVMLEWSPLPILWPYCFRLAEIVFPNGTLLHSALSAAASVFTSTATLGQLQANLRQIHWSN